MLIAGRYAAAASAGIINARQKATLTAIIILSMALTPLAIAALNFALVLGAAALQKLEVDSVEIEQIILIGGIVLVRRLTARPNPQGGHRRVADRLSELESLRQTGQISPAEYEKQRASIISSV